MGGQEVQTTFAAQSSLIVTLYGLLELNLGIFSQGGNIAHFAHSGGMLGGLVLLFWRSQNRSC